MDYELLLSSEAERCIEDQLLWYEGAARVTVLQVRHEKRPLLPETGP